MDARSSNLGVDIYFLPLLIPLLLSPVLVAVIGGGTGLLVPSHEELEVPKGKKILSFLTFLKKASDELQME